MWFRITSRAHSITCALPPLSGSQTILAQSRHAGGGRPGYVFRRPARGQKRGVTQLEKTNGAACSKRQELNNCELPRWCTKRIV
jgi:hypothetical protein